MAVTAKVKIYSIAPGFAETTGLDQSEHTYAPLAPEQAVSFTADYMTEDGKEKNFEWSKYTPSLNLMMTVKSEVVKQQGWEVGKSFTLTFEESD